MLKTSGSEFLRSKLFESDYNDYDLIYFFTFRNSLLYFSLNHQKPHVLYYERWFVISLHLYCIFLQIAQGALQNMTSVTRTLCQVCMARNISDINVPKA